MQCSNKDVFVAGDVAGIEEASSAMLEGTIAGISIAEDMGVSSADMLEQKKVADQYLSAMRDGDTGSKIRFGLSKVEVEHV